MREQFRSTPPEVRLTTRPVAPRLVGGDIFMPAAPAQTENPHVRVNTLRRENPLFHNPNNGRPGAHWIPRMPDALLQDLPHVEAPPDLTPERRDRERNQWRAFYQAQGEDVGSWGVTQNRVIDHLIDRGTPVPRSGGADRIDPTRFTDATLQAIIEEYNDEVDRVGAGRRLNPRFLQEQIERVQNLRDARDAAGRPRVNAAESREILRQMRVAFQEASPPSLAVEDAGRFWKLGNADYAILNMAATDPEGAIIAWVNGKFDILYEAARGRDAAQSQVLQEINAAVSEASKYLESINPDAIRILANLYETRTGLMGLRRAIGSKSWEGILGAAGYLKTHGFFTGYGLDKGRAGSMAHRLDTKLEDMRIDTREGVGNGGPRKHVSPEMVTRLQEEVINEQIALAKAGVGQFRDFSAMDDKTIRQEVTRAVRAGFDLLQSSQRLPVIASRGKNLTGSDAYFSDAGSAFSMFNIETFHTKKWGIWNDEDSKLTAFLRKQLVEDYKLKNKDHRESIDMTPQEEEELGKRLFRDFAAPPDFFSSGWRIKGITNQLGNYFRLRGAPAGYADNFALFIRLQAEEEAPGREREWRKIATYRQEEIIKLLHDRLSDADRRQMEQEVFAGAVGGVTDYISFKEKYGATINAAREDGLRRFTAGEMPTQLDLSVMHNLRGEVDTRAQHLFDNAARTIGPDGQPLIPGDSSEIQRIFQRMNEYITNHNVINTLQFGHRFADIYKRAITTDDALLDILEDPRSGFTQVQVDPQGNTREIPYTPDNFNMVPLSEIYGGGEGGSDAMVRTLSDIKDGGEAMMSFVEFVRTKDPREKMKLALDFGKKTSIHSGRAGEAAAIRYSIVSYLEAAAIPEWFDALGIAKLPFRIPLTDLERIEGPHAKPLSQDERRHMLDGMRATLNAATETRIEELQEDYGRRIAHAEANRNFAEAEHLRHEMEHKIEHERHAAEEHYFRAEKVLKVRAWDIVRRRAKTFLAAIFIIMIGELYSLTESALPTRSGGGGGH